MMWEKGSNQGEKTLKRQINQRGSINSHLHAHLIVQVIFDATCSALP
jgi:hypothetical protein